VFISLWWICSTFLSTLNLISSIPHYNSFTSSHFISFSVLHLIYFTCRCVLEAEEPYSTSGSFNIHIQLLAEASKYASRPLNARDKPAIPTLLPPVTLWRCLTQRISRRKSHRDALKSISSILCRKSAVIKKAVTRNKSPKPMQRSHGNFTWPPDYMLPALM
jgi:hypothetical protein